MNARGILPAPHIRYVTVWWGGGYPGWGKGNPYPGQRKYPLATIMTTGYYPLPSVLAEEGGGGYPYPGLGVVQVYRPLSPYPDREGGGCHPILARKDLAQGLGYPPQKEPGVATFPPPGLCG